MGTLIYYSADRKWFTCLVVTYLIHAKLKFLNLAYPTVTKAHRQEFLKAKVMLEQKA